MATVSIDQAFINAGTPLADNTIYKFIENVTMSVPFTFVTLNNMYRGITVDGSGHTITVTTTQPTWPGLLDQAVTVQNLGILPDTTINTAQIAQSAGWFFAASTGGTATNCYSTGSIPDSGGGIFGANVSSNSGNSTSINCYSTGTIGNNGGGIFGASSVGSAYNSYSTGGSSIGGTNSTVFEIMSGTSSGWSDASANMFLNKIPGTTPQVWYSIGANTPYVLIPPPPVSDTPTLSAIQCGNGLVNLIWNQPNNNGSEITSYNVYQAVSTTGSFTRVSSNINFIGTTAVVSGLTNLTTYYFQVSAVNAGGESVKSSTISGMPGIVPSAPQNVTGVAGNKSVALSWSPPSTVGTPSLTSYYVYVSSTFENDGGAGAGGPGGAGGGGGQTIDTSYTIVSSISVTGTSVTIPRLTNGTAYRFKVSAYNSIGEGSQSAASSSITPAQAASATVPSAPQLLNAVAGDSSVTLTWTAPISDGGASVTSYKVYNATTSAEITTNITRPTSTSATITGLTNGTSVQYVVKAVNTAGAGTSATSPSVMPNSLIANISSIVSTLGTTNSISGAIDSLITETCHANNTNLTYQSSTDAQTYAGVQVMTQTDPQALSTTAETLVSTMFTRNLVSINTSAYTFTVLSLINTINQLNTSGQSTAVNSLASALVSNVGNGRSLSLNSTQTTSLLSNKQNVSNKLPTTLQVIVPAISNIITLPTNTSVYLSLVPGVQYTVEVTTSKKTTTAYLTYNASTQKLEFQMSVAGPITNYAVGSSIKIGAYQYQIFTIGSGGTSPEGDVTNVVASTTSNSATVTWTNPTVDFTFSNKIIASAGGVITTYNQAGVSGASASKTISGLAPGTAVSFTVTTIDAEGEESDDVIVVTTVPDGTVPCFPTGTRILTPSGYKQVEDLVQNELVVTAECRHVPVKIYGRKFSHATKQIAPFTIPKSALGRNMPSHSLTLSPDHAFLIRKGVWMLPSRAALLSDAVIQVGVGSPVAYYHLECPNYLRDNLVVDGVVVESYAANQLNCKSPYTYNENLKGYTRASPAISTKNTLSL